MSPDRTAPTSLRPAHGPRSAAPAAPADGFAALLGAADKAAGSGRREPAASERGLERRRAGEVPGQDDSRHPGRGSADAGRSAAHAARREPVAPPAAPVEQGAPAAAPAAVMVPPAAPDAVAPVPADLAPLGAPAADAAPLPGSTSAESPAGAPVAPAAQSTGAPLPGQPQPGLATPQPAAATATAQAAATATAQAAATVEAAAPVAGAPAPAAGAIPTAAEPMASISAPALEPAPAAPAAQPAPAVPTGQAPADQAPADQGPSASPAPAGQGSAGQGAGSREQAGADADVQAPVTPAPSAPAAPAAAPAAPAAPLAQRSAPLHLAPRAVAQTLHVAIERGISHARLNLRPAELGGIEIRLQTSSAGVTAQVVADSPEAARLLQQAADDLRRSLERHDVTLLSLDVSTAGDGQPDGSAGASADAAEERARHFAAHGLRRAPAEADEPSVVVETVALPDGVHIDVLA